MEPSFILLLALLIDVLFGEPPQVLHPVVWMGKITSLWERFAPASRPSPDKGRCRVGLPLVRPSPANGWGGRESPFSPSPSNREGKVRQLVYGGVMLLVTVFIFASPVYFLLLLLKADSYQLSAINIAYIIAGALLLKPTFSFRELRQTALEIKGLLARDNLEGVRTRMPALVSRETRNLEKPALVSATVESVAENIGDSFVAPLFYFLLFGVSGAVAYRVVNTVDAMIGYHGKYEYLGKFAAKLDDVLNFIPARISGLLLVIAACLCRRDGRNAWKVMLRDHGKTESPNAGWPMSAVAGALKVRLEKAGCYSLGNPNSPLSPWLIASGVKLAIVSALLWVLFCLIMEVTHFVFVA